MHPHHNAGKACLHGPRHANPSHNGQTVTTKLEPNKGIRLTVTQTQEQVSRAVQPLPTTHPPIIRGQTDLRGDPSGEPAQRTPKWALMVGPSAIYTSTIWQHVPH